MGKLMDRLQVQLKTEYKQDAEDCLEIYNHLKNTTGNVWESQWNPLVETIFEGWNKRRFKPTATGYTFIKGLNNKKVMEEQTKCYCGHTTYCDCGPQEPKQETLEKYNYLQGFINQFEEEGEHQELSNDDWTVSQFLKWMKINNFIIVKDENKK
jgi:hypothetical protein